MSKDKFRWIVFLLIVAILCSTVIFVQKMSKVINSPETFIIIFSSTIFNAFIIVAGYAIFRKIRNVAFWKLIIYFVFTSTGSSCIEILLYMRGHYAIPFLNSDNYLFFVLGGFLLLVFFNYLLLRMIFAASMRKAYLIGISVSLLNMILLLPPISKM